MGGGSWSIRSVRPRTRRCTSTDYVGSWADAIESGILSQAAGDRRQGRGRDQRRRRRPDASGGCWRSPFAATVASIAVLSKEWTRACRPHSGRSRTPLLDHVREVRPDDRGRLVPVPRPRRRLERRTAGRRRRADRRRHRHGHVRVAERQLRAAPRRDPGQPGRHASRRARLPRRAGAPGVRAPRADRRGVRAGRRRHPAVSVRADPRRRRRRRGAARSTAGCCSCATSPNSASATGCC